MFFFFFPCQTNNLQSWYLSVLYLCMHSLTWTFFQLASAPQILMQRKPLTLWNMLIVLATFRISLLWVSTLDWLQVCWLWSLYDFLLLSNLLIRLTEIQCQARCKGCGSNLSSCKQSYMLAVEELRAMKFRFYIENLKLIISVFISCLAADSPRYKK